MSDTTMLVPVKVNALMVNPQNQRLPFRRWRPNYNALNEYLSPLPGAFQGEMTTNFGLDPFYQGVYLQWELPKGLRHGIAERRDSNPEFPLLPNRWLVVRFYGETDQRQAKAWVLESDCPNTTDDRGSDDSTPFLIAPEIVNAWKASDSPERQQAAQTLLDGSPQAEEGGIYVNFLGKPFDQSGWQEQGIDQLFLKAVAPGNVEFLAYQPAQGNIFSFHDPVQNDEGVFESSELSYFVAGWFSNPSDDPLSKWTTNEPGLSYDDLLKALGWEVADDPSEKADSSIYHGLVYGLDWQTTSLPPNTIQEVSDLHVAIGNNATDAFQNMINQQMEDLAATNPEVAQFLEEHPEFSEILEAFQYDLLYLYDEPSGPVVLENRIRQEWFGPRAGGYRWYVTDKDDIDPTETTELTRDELITENAWLITLNENQEQFDLTRASLLSTQEQLYGLWWKYQRWLTYPSFAEPGGLTSDQFLDMMDPSNPNSLTSQINDLNTQLTALAATLPMPIYTEEYTLPEEALQNGIDAFSANLRANGQLSDNRDLKPKSIPSYSVPNDPVMLVTGAKSSQTLLDQGPLQVRIMSQVVSSFSMTGFTTVDQSNIGNYLPAFDFSNLIPGMNDLYFEAFLLDPINANSICLVQGAPESETQSTMEAHNPDNYSGVIPDLPLEYWAQPWTPLYFEWELRFIPIDQLDANGDPNWTFDGTDYRYTGAPPEDAVSFAISGRDLMTSQLTAIFENRLKEYITTHPDNPNWSAIENWLESNNWDFLAQSFTNFNRWLSTLNSQSNLQPAEQDVYGQNVDIPALVNGNTEVLPFPPSNSETQTFQGLRQGQFFVKQMIIYDAFGQVLNVVEPTESGSKSYELFHPILGPEMTPDQFVIDSNPYRLAQLPPRMLQSARLNFRLTDAIDTTRYADIDELANPVGGWLLPNHLENGISLYSPEGQSLGVARLLVDTTGARNVGWQAPPHSDINSMGDVSNVAPLVADWYNAISAQGSDAFEAFIEVIDETLWTIDPLGNRSDQNLSVLIGRPLALTSAEISFELAGPPNTDQSWEATFDDSAPSYTQEEFDIRLGEPEIRRDGLIGYYLNGNWSTFHNVHNPTGLEDSYLDPIVPGQYFSLKFDGVSKVNVILLADPRAAVHVMTGLFPVGKVVIPNRYVNPALSMMEISFHINGLLTEIQSNPDADTVGSVPTAVTLPLPAEQKGSWSWWEEVFSDGNISWTGRGLAGEDETARITDLEKSLRDGFLQLIIDLQKN